MKQYWFDIEKEKPISNVIYDVVIDPEKTEKDLVSFYCPQFPYTVARICNLCWSDEHQRFFFTDGLDKGKLIDSGVVVTHYRPSPTAIEFQDPTETARTVAEAFAKSVSPPLSEETLKDLINRIEAGFVYG